jgi:predicted  nucleic acid-binding Zn-ribbon protein
MLQRVLDLGKQLISVMHRVHKSEQDTKDLRRDLNELTKEVSELTRTVERLAFETQKDRENAERDREIQRLSLENILLRFERMLPPAGKTKSGK